MLKFHRLLLAGLREGIERSVHVDVHEVGLVKRVFLWLDLNPGLPGSKVWVLSTIPHRPTLPGFYFCLGRARCGSEFLVVSCFRDMEVVSPALGFPCPHRIMFPSGSPKKSVELEVAPTAAERDRGV